MGCVQWLPDLDSREPVAEPGVARRAELRLDEIVLACLVAEKDLLRLVRRRHDDGGDQAGERDRAEPEQRVDPTHTEDA